MTWKGRPAPPTGYELAVIRKGDTLASLERESGISATKIAEANGVPFTGSKSCAWAKDVSAWVLATGGVRYPAVKGQENTCEAGLGFTGFVEGQLVNLPTGLRPRAPGAPPGEISTASVAGGAGALILALGAVLLIAKRRKKAA